MTISCVRTICAAAILALATAQAASAQTASTGDWKFAVYPVLGWVPLGIGIDVDVPDSGGGSAGGGEIIDGRFDGAFLGGVSATNGTFRIDTDFIWAAVGGDRVERPILTVDADIIYGHGMFSYAVAPEWFIGVGVRRMALKYSVKVGDLPTFERKPGVWDPLVGVGWHRPGNKLDWHAIFEIGGFGAGTDLEMNAGLHVDWRPATHFGLTAGYNFLYFKVTDDVRDRVFTVEQTLHGPKLGIGFYF